MTSWAVGAVINIIGGIIINLGTNLFKLGHSREQLSRNVAHVPFRESPRAWLSVPGRLLWLTGLLLFITGNVLNFVSFAFAAQSLLAALAAVQFLANVIFARLLNGERAPRGVLLATGVVVVGCVLLVAFGNHASPVLDASALLELYASPGYIAYICTLAAFTAAVALFYRHGSRKLRRAAAHEESLRRASRGAGEADADAAEARELEDPPSTPLPNRGSKTPRGSSLLRCKWARSRGASPSPRAAGEERREGGSPRAAGSAEDRDWRLPSRRGGATSEAGPPSARALSRLRVQGKEALRALGREASSERHEGAQRQDDEDEAPGLLLGMPSSSPLPDAAFSSPRPGAGSSMPRPGTPSSAQVPPLPADAASAASPRPGKDPLRFWKAGVPVAYAAVAASIGTQSVVFGKALAMLLRASLGGKGQLGQWYTWVALLLFGAFALFWVVLYSSALRNFPVLTMMPLLMVACIFFSMLSGAAYYQEYRAFGLLSGVAFGLGSAVLLLGVYLLARCNVRLVESERRRLRRALLRAQRAERERERAEEEEEEEEAPDSGPPLRQRRHSAPEKPGAVARSPLLPFFLPDSAAPEPDKAQGARAAGASAGTPRISTRIFEGDLEIGPPAEPSAAPSALSDALPARRASLAERCSSALRGWARGLRPEAEAEAEAGPGSPRPGLERAASGLPGAPSGELGEPSAAESARAAPAARARARQLRVDVRGSAGSAGPVTPGSALLAILSMPGTEVLNCTQPDDWPHEGEGGRGGRRGRSNPWLADSDGPDLTDVDEGSDEGDARGGCDLEANSGAREGRTEQGAMRLSTGEAGAQNRTSEPVNDARPIDEAAFEASGRSGRPTPEAAWPGAEAMAALSAREATPRPAGQEDAWWNNPLAGSEDEGATTSARGEAVYPLWERDGSPGSCRAGGTPPTASHGEGGGLSRSEGKDVVARPRWR